MGNLGMLKAKIMENSRRKSKEILAKWRLMIMMKEMVYLWMNLFAIDGLIFTAEMEEMRKKEMKREGLDEAMSDEDIEEGSSESVSDFEEEKGDSGKVPKDKKDKKDKKKGKKGGREEDEDD